MGSPLQGFLSGGFKQSPADSAAAVIPGNMEAVNDEPAFVQLRYQHYDANHVIIFISAICHVLPAEDLFRFFGKARCVPILSEGIVNQRQIPVLQAVYIFTSWYRRKPFSESRVKLLLSMSFISKV